MTVYTYKTMPLEWRDTRHWSIPETDELNDAESERFNRLQKGLSWYLRTGKLTTAAQTAQCSPSVLIRQLNRCLTPTESGQIHGWTGLVKHLRVKAYERKASLPDGLGKNPSGTSGAFRRLLFENPEIRKVTDDAILKGIGRNDVRTSRPTFKSVYKVFKTVCERQLRTDQYPLNSRSKGRRSLERYAKQLIASDSKTMSLWYGEQAAVKLRLGTGLSSFPFAAVPFDVAGADAHKIHAIGIAVVPGPAGPQRIPVERLWLYGYADEGSRAMLGYSVAIRKEPSAAHLEQAVCMALNPWKPRALRIAGLSYAPGAGFPAGTIDGIDECRVSVLKLDNAAQHYAERSRERLRRRVGCAVSWGPVGGWWHKAIGERIFQTLEIYGFQRLSSSTGSNPMDPNRSAPVGRAVDHCVEWEELLDLIDVVIANYNAEPSKALGGRSPLDVLREHLASRRPAFLPRVGAPETVMTPRLGVSVERRTMRGARKRGRVVNVYVEVDGTRYSSPALCHEFDWINHFLVLHIDEEDMRTVHAYLDNGVSIGELTVLNRSWSHSKHSRDMRKQINRLIQDGVIDSHSPDVIQMFLDHLARKASEEARQRPGQVSSAATALAAAARASGKSVGAVTDLPSALPKSVPKRPLPGHLAKPTWHNT